MQTATDAYIEFLKALVSRGDCGSERVKAVRTRSITLDVHLLSVCLTEAKPKIGCARKEAIVVDTGARGNTPRIINVSSVSL